MFDASFHVDLIGRSHSWVSRMSLVFPDIVMTFALFRKTAINLMLLWHHFLTLGFGLETCTKSYYLSVLFTASPSVYCYTIIDLLLISKVSSSWRAKASKMYAKTPPIYPRPCFKSCHRGFQSNITSNPRYWGFCPLNPAKTEQTFMQIISLNSIKPAL